MGAAPLSFQKPVVGTLALRAPVTRRTAQGLQSTRPGAPVAPRSNNPGRREASSKQRQRKGDEIKEWEEKYVSTVNQPLRGRLSGETAQERA